MPGGSVLGKLTIGCIWLAVAGACAVLISLMTLQLEGHYWLSQEKTANVTIAARNASAVTAGGAPISTSYLAVFPSGEQHNIEVPGPATLEVGEAVEIKYVVTFLRKAVIVRSTRHLGKPAAR